MEFVLVETKRQKKKIITPNTPEQELYIAIETENAPKIQKLLTADIDLTSTVNGWTLLTAACAYGQEDVVQAIIGKLIDLEKTRPGSAKAQLYTESVLDAFNDNGDTPLICAARAGHVNVCSQLLEAGAYVNQTNQHIRQTPLLVAIEQGHTDVVEYLLDCGADVQITDNISITPLYAAIKTRCARLVQRLVSAGCDVNLGSQDHAPLFLAARLNQLEIVQILCNAGCQKDITIKYDVTPLYEAAFRGNAEIVEYLVNEGCDVNKTDMYGVSPLHIASMNGHLECVKHLMEGGADMRLRMEDGETALHVAMEMNRANVVEYFLELGEDLFKKPHSHISLRLLLGEVFGKGNKETVKVLLRSCSKMLMMHFNRVEEMFSDKEMLQMMLMSGSNISPSITSQIVTNPGKSEWLENFNKNPMSLKALARIRLRGSLGNKILYHVKNLPLPTSLKDYVFLIRRSKCLGQSELREASMDL